MSTIPLKRILYIEDEADIQEIAKLALEAIGGFTIKVCSSGNEAILHIDAFSPDLILLDVMMPGMDGPTTLKAIRKIPRFSTTPVIFMTAKVQVHEAASYKALGNTDVIAKPFDPMTLADTIKTIWHNLHG